MDDKGIQFSYISIDELIGDERQPRKFMDGEESLKSLVENIKSSEIFTPIQYRIENGKKLIVMGERRWRAAKIAGLKEVPAIEYQGKTDYRIASFKDNQDRKKLLPMEEAQYLKWLYDELNREQGISQEKFAEIIGIGKSTLSEKINLTKLPEEIQKEALTGPEWTAQKLIQLSKLSGEDQKHAFEVMCKSETASEATTEYAGTQIVKWQKSLKTMRKKVEKEIPTSLPEEIRVSYSDRIKEALNNLESIFMEMEEKCKDKKEE